MPDPSRRQRLRTLVQEIAGKPRPRPTKNPCSKADFSILLRFGDGAGAALVSARPGRWRMLDAVLHSDGKYRADLAFGGTGPLRMNG